MVLLCCSAMTVTSSRISVYEGDKLEGQMRATVEEYLNHHVTVTPRQGGGGGTVMLPYLMGRYGKDFGGDDVARLEWVKQFLIPRKANELMAIVSSKKVHVKYDKRETGFEWVMDPAVDVWTQKNEERFAWTKEQQQEWLQRNQHLRPPASVSPTKKPKRKAHPLSPFACA
jgi:hypothetical protein